MQEEFEPNFIALFTFLYWAFLFFWTFQEASEMSKAEKDTSGGTFIAGLALFSLISGLIWSITAALLETQYQWINIAFIAAHFYWMSSRD